MAYGGVVERICRGAVCKSARAWAEHDKEKAAENKKKKGKSKDTDTSMYRRTNSGRYG